MNKRSHFRKQAGVSIVELMVGLVVVSIVAGFLALGAGSFMKTYRMKLSANEVLSYINYARLQAAKTRRAYRLQFYAAGVAYTGDTNDHIKPTNTASTKSEAGTILMTQGSSADPKIAFPEFDATADKLGVEKKQFEFAKAYKDIQITRTSLENNTRVNPLKLYFRPNGFIQSCTKATEVVCTNETFVICVQDPEETTGANAIPKRIIVSFNGQIEVKPDTGGLCSAS